MVSQFRAVQWDGLHPLGERIRLRKTVGPDSTGSMAKPSPVELDPLPPTVEKEMAGSETPALAHCLSPPVSRPASQPGPSYKCLSPSGLTTGGKPVLMTISMIRLPPGR